MLDKEYIVKDVEGGLIEEEPIIRCKDCKYHYYHETLKQDYCEIPNMQFGEVEPRGYCHRAERKDEYVTLHHEDIHFIDDGAERAFYESLEERKEK